MERQAEKLLDQLRALRRRRHVEPEVTVPEDNHRPRWDSTTKVVVGVILLILFAVAVYVFRVIFVPLIIGLIMAYILQPVVRFIRRATRLPRGAATALLYLTLLALVIPIGAFLIPAMIDQIVYVQGQMISFARYLNTIGADTTTEVLGFSFGVQELVRQVTSGLTDFITSVASDSISFVLDAARILLLVVFTFVIGFYLTRDAESVMTSIRGLIPPSYRSDTEVLLSEFDSIWSAFFRGQVLLSLIVTGILTTLSALLGLPQPLLLGVWGGLLEFLPSIGNTIWGLTVLIVALVSGSTYLPLPNAIFALVVFGAYVAFAQLDINFLIPTIIGRQMRLHPVVVILGVIVGATVGGPLGVALAAPTIASLRVIGRYLYANLYDLDPFPMVGAPSLPRQERVAELDRTSSVIPPDSSPESN
ncbi:MAG: AI-2E family transporter [Anaerolineales bacterium]|nr:MAG: AI-2E family transporter [Anaerolineales bacterium]